MTGFGLAIGCGCCGPFDCRTENYPRGQFPLFGWSAFPINEGTTRPDLLAQSLSAGQRMQAPEDVLSRGSEAWYHLIRFEGDVDLDWDGIRIEVRPAQGTITTDGVVVPIIPMASGIDSPTARRITDVMLIVTPDWYAVVYFPIRITQQFIIRTNRGAIQVVDRINDPTRRNVTLTMRSPQGSVVNWTVSDMSVQIRGNEITRQCPRPELPDGTEHLQISQTSGFNVYVDQEFADAFGVSGTSRIPNSFTTSNYGIFFSSGGIVGRLDFEWNEFAVGGRIQSLPPELAPLYSYRGNINTGILFPNFQTLRLIQSSLPTTVGARIGFHQRVVWRRQTVANPYPKPESLTPLGLQDIETFVPGDNQFALAEYDAQGRAAASVSATAQATVTWSTY